MRLSKYGGVAHNEEAGAGTVASRLNLTARGSRMSELIETESRRAYIVRAIEGISEQLKGPLSNLERALLVADRRDFRDELKIIDAR